MTTPTPLQDELKQTRPFRTPAQEAVVSILRTADVLRRRFGALVEEQGITLQEYNVLRILRGARGEPLPTLEIRERMIERTPGITRFVTRLEERGLIHRERCTEDRRKVHCTITDEGLALLERLDAPMDEADDTLARDVTDEELEALSDVLARIRGAG